MDTELNPCSDYDPKTRSCKAGHVQLMPLCWGSTERACPGCGHIANLPQCLKEDPPAHLIRGDGMPLLWPHKMEPRS